jgi:uncharacterized Zn-binding protein involved in type VI secretion
MGKPAAKQGDQVIGTDIHIIMIPTPGGPVPVPLPHIFSGQLDSALSADVNIEGKAAATQGSKAGNTPPHIPLGGPFQTPPKNQAEIMLGSATVSINGKPAARLGDLTLTCNDPADMPVGQLIAVSTVMIGG